MLAAAIVALATSEAGAHSASDAYLTLELAQDAQPAAAASTLVHGQWDIALRDLDFALTLDDDGDGNIVWAELRRHQGEIARYAFEYLHASVAGNACTVEPTRQMVDSHADGAYAALFFDMVCPRATAVPARIVLDYRLFFAIDPSHRGILVFRSGSATSTSLLSPDNAKVELKPQPDSFKTGDERPVASLTQTEKGVENGAANVLVSRRR